MSPSAGRRVAAMLCAGLLTLPGTGTASVPQAFARPREAVEREDLTVAPRVAPSAGMVRNPKPMASSPLVYISGWFHVVWNGAPRYVLVDDRGRWTRLVLNEEITKPHGGPLVLRGKRVLVVGVYVQEPPGALSVRCIKIEPR